VQGDKYFILRIENGPTVVFPPDSPVEVVGQDSRRYWVVFSGSSGPKVPVDVDRTYALGRDSNVIVIAETRNVSNEEIQERLTRRGTGAGSR
jgi:hypothetical protein